MRWHREADIARGALKVRRGEGIRVRLLFLRFNRRPTGVRERRVIYDLKSPPSKPEKPASLKIG